MAKILHINIPAHGHVNPTLPVATELFERGHHVIYYNSASFEQLIRGTGVEFRPYPNSDDSEADFARRINILANVSVHLLEESIRLLPFLLTEIDQEKPDLMIFDSIALWGMFAARLQNIPSVVFITTLVSDGVPGIFKWRDYFHVFRQGFPVLPVVLNLRRRLVTTYGSGIFPGKSILPCRGDLNIVFTSRYFQPSTAYVDESFHFVGPSILATTRKNLEFPWDRLDSQRTKIYLSLGTLYNNNRDFYRTVITAFADYPAQFILSTGIEINGPGIEMPDNFIVRPHVPQLDILQKVDLFVTHGGMNSINESLYYGVPLVVVPQQIEQVFNGRRVAHLGSGVILADSPPYGKTSAARLRHSVEKVLADPEYRINAEKISRSFRDSGGYKRAANIITSMIGV